MKLEIFGNNILVFEYYKLKDSREQYNVNIRKIIWS